MSQALCFNEITFSPVNRHNSPWIRAVELSKALGFKREDQAPKFTVPMWMNLPRADRRAGHEYPYHGVSEACSAGPD